MPICYSEQEGAFDIVQLYEINLRMELPWLWLCVKSTMVDGICHGLLS